MAESDLWVDTSWIDDIPLEMPVFRKEPILVGQATVSPSQAACIAIKGLDMMKDFPVALERARKELGALEAESLAELAALEKRRLALLAEAEQLRIATFDAYAKDYTAAMRASWSARGWR